MKKKLLAVVLSAVMVFGCFSTSVAATSNSFTSVGAWGANSGSETLTGDFDVTYTLYSETTYSDGATLMKSSNDTIGIEIRSETGDGYFVIRPDIYGWWGGTWAQDTALGNLDTWTIKCNDEAGLSVNNEINWYTWRATFAFADMTINLKRVDGDMTIHWITEGDNGITYDITIPIATTVEFGDTITSTLVVPANEDNNPTVTVYDLKFADNNKLETIGAQTNTTGDKLAFVTTVDKDLIDNEEVEELSVILTKGEATGFTLDDVNGTTVIKGATAYVTTDTDAGADDDSYAFRTIINGPDVDDTYTAIPYMLLADGTEVYGTNCSRSIEDIQ